MPSTRFVVADEGHGARPKKGDARQIDIASARQRKCDEWRGAELVRHRRIDTDALAGTEPASLRNESGDVACSALATGGWHGAACSQGVRAKRSFRLHEKKRKSATR